MKPKCEKEDGNFGGIDENWKASQVEPRKYEIIYRNVVLFTYIHVAGMYGFYLCVLSAKWETILFGHIVNVISAIGITAGAHRLWAHRSYKAKLPLQIILMLCHNVAYQKNLIWWSRDHRLHHKFCETDADPQNAGRGFFFSHIGWLLVRKHPEIKRRAKLVDMSDLYSNPVLRFQKKYERPLTATAAFILPTLIPIIFWQENFINAYNVNMFRFTLNIHSTFLLNSVAHMWGHRPYDKNISAAQCLLLSLLTFGEGFHNFHHVFPSDYRTAEQSNSKINYIKMFIDFFAWFGWAYDLKTVSEDVIQKRAERTGDGTDLWGRRKKADEKRGEI